MPYIHFTEDQKLRANSVDLVEFLRRQGEKLISSGQDKRLTSDHSITVHGNEWYDHAAERGGHAISFVQNFYGLTYPEAVTRLLNGEQGEVYVPAEKKEKEPPKEFALPPSNQTMRRVYAYLLQQRHISREVLSAFAQKGLIYESRELSIDQTKVYHNAVFVGFDERGVARHAHKRGLYTQGKSYRGNIEGSDPRCSFHWVGTSDRLYVFEAPQEELEQVLGFLRDTGLPLTLAQLGVKEIVPETLKKVAEAAVVPTQSTKNLRADITAQEVYDAILEADRIGRDYLAR